MLVDRGCKKILRALGTASIAAFVASAPAFAAELHLFPQTKLGIKVVQWSPTKAIYEDWPALGGEFIVSESGTLALPLIGSLDVAKLDSEGVAQEYAERLQAKTGLLRKPEISVSVVEYPPIYVAGDVVAPGEHKFRPNLTALQALAMSGGLQKDKEEAPEGHVKLLFDLQASKIDILRSRMRIARLTAEMSDSENFDFPKLADSAEDKATFEELYKRENIIFVARKNELVRQAATLNELRDLLNAEIGTLDQKAAATDDAIKSLEKELEGVRELVEKGVAVRSRQSDLERLLAGLRADRLDRATEVMRARQSIAEATRNIDGLHDHHRTEVATEIQTESVNLEQAELKRDLTRNLLLKSIEDEAARSEARATIVTTMTIVRNEDGKPVKFTAADETPLMPGDVLTISREISGPASREPEPEDLSPEKLSRAEP